MTCSRCRAAFYCGEPCQKAHWRAHKPGCALMAAAPAAAAGGSRAAAAAAAPHAPHALTLPSYEGWSVKQLKEELRARGLSAAGMTERSELVGALAASPPPLTAAASGGGGSAGPAPSKRFLYSGMEQVLDDLRCGMCKTDLSHRGRGEEQQLACGGCRSVPYCDMECLEAHYLGHMEECFMVIRARVLAGDVHKDDASGEYVLKDYVGECMSKTGPWTSARWWGSASMGPFCGSLGGWRRPRSC